MRISPEGVELIQQWAAENCPKAEIEVTGYDEKTGAAEGVVVHVNKLEIEQAEQLLELREKLKCHVSIGNSKNLDAVTFDMLFPTDHPRTY